MVFLLWSFTLCTPLIPSAVFLEESLQLCKFQVFIKFLTCYKYLKIMGLGIPCLSEWLPCLWTFVKGFDLFPAELPLAWRCGCLADWVMPILPLCPDKLSVLGWYLYLVPFYFLFLELNSGSPFTVSSHFKPASFFTATWYDRIYATVFFLYLTQLGLC